MEENEIYEYELIDIEFEQPYEQIAFAREDSPMIEYDADGIPMGNSHEEIEMRRHIISTFYHKWKEQKRDRQLKMNHLSQYSCLKNTCRMLPFGGGSRRGLLHNSEIPHPKHGLLS